MDSILAMADAIGPANVLTAADDIAPYSVDWRGAYRGTPEAVLRPGTTARVRDGEHTVALDAAMLERVHHVTRELNQEGLRVVAVAMKEIPPSQVVYSVADESDLTLIGYIAFLDPPKESTAPALKALAQNGITVKILTGDNELVTSEVCRQVGLVVQGIVLGAQIDRMDDKTLAAAVETHTIFAKLSPLNKERIVRSLRGNGHVVGFMGDGINDAPALRAADIGISVDTAVDIAKEAADIILLERSLMVLEEGVIEGRKVFANILKYIRMGASSNFGNMFSVLGASAFLPFVPMLPLQILTNNLLYDFSQVAIPTDEVDPEQVTRPRPWAVDEIKKFILFIGPISSIFDYSTYFIMLYVFGCWDPARASLFQTGWFVESLMTQTLIIHIIRTNKIPFIQSRPSLLLMVTTVVIMAIGAYLPFSPLGPALGFTPLPPLYWPLLAATLACYVVLTQIVKTWLLKKLWIR